MLIAKIFQNGQSQAVNLPKEYNFEGDEVCIKKIGDLVLLFSPDKEWDIFMSGINGFSDDFHVERLNDVPENRVVL
ncbi:MAG: type II toxin-antitoxin system VapB family antitoxin [Oscillospiraceae bacterium]|nr:type II toxin-antitoxin system VapB family antitoxin [Oscillospiraceae bacterium]